MMLPRTTSELQNLHTQTATVDGVNIPIRHSRNLPHKLWVVIAKSLGIKLHEDEKPIISTLFYVVTYLAFFGFSFTTFWFTVTDIISKYTKTSIIDGMIDIIYTILWGALGLYARKLAFRLYSHAHFTKLIKLHSKTILKMNAAVLLFLLMTLFIIVNNVSGWFHTVETVICQRDGIDAVVCKLRFTFRVIYSVFALLWNYLVAFALTSICRSHVIRIRKFMKILEQDSKCYEAKFLGLGSMNENVNNTSTPLEEYSWVDEDYLIELDDNEESVLFEGRKLASRNHDSSNVGIPDQPSTSTIGITTETSPGERGTTEPQNRKDVNPILTNDEILFNYWKIQSDLRISSVALQRWMISVISLVVIWLTMNLVLWLKQDPNLFDLVNFLLPLLLLPLLSSAYAEVNQEGQRALKFICLTEKRLQVVLVLQTCPLEMAIYNYSLSYKAIGTAAFGVLLALATKIILQKAFG